MDNGNGSSPAGNPAKPGNVPSEAAIEAWLTAYIAETLGVRSESIDVRRPFSYFGLSSAEGVILAGDLEKWLGGRRLPATLAWDYPTIETMARYLATPEGSKDEHLSATASFEAQNMEALLSEIEGLPEKPRQEGGAPSDD